MKKFFLSVPVDDLSIEHIIDLMNQKSNKRSINIMSANITAIRRFDAQYKKFSEQFDLLIADGKDFTPN
jgi:UDP-N-acetyl-D-mannosaminuronic acid transferase (WecB/TagA/CpsF family)